ncbi:MAG TPA: hypothetical protein VH418_04185 [Solirubrobacteraceae bacterium]|jgi:uncharacterized cupredoxin-like copper-binding protein
MRALPAVVVIALLAAGCAGGASPAAHGDAPVQVTERDFRISAPRQVRAGDVRFEVHNRGPVAHEFIVVKLAGARLPLRRDGITVDEDAVEARTAATLEPQRAGATTDVQARLTPGRYELLCNMAGHYRGGMHAALVVR